MTVTDEPPVVTGEQIASITQDVWASFLLMDLVPVADDALPGHVMTGVVSVSGEWEGSVILEVPLEHAVAAAEAMFAADPGSLSDDEVGDALGELTNMVGGNIKGLLPAPSRLSIPSVASGEHVSIRVPGARLVDRVVLRCGAGTVSVSVWKV